MRIRPRVIFLIGLAAAVGFYFYRKRQAAAAQAAQDATDTQDGSGTDTTNMPDYSTNPEFSDPYGYNDPNAQDSSAIDQSGDLVESPDLGAPAESGILTPVGPSPGGTTAFLPPTSTGQSGGGPSTTNINVHYPKTPGPHRIPPVNGKCKTGYRAVRYGKDAGKLRGKIRYCQKMDPRPL